MSDDDKHRVASVTLSDGVLTVTFPKEIDSRDAAVMQSMFAIIMSQVTDEVEALGATCPQG